MHRLRRICGSPAVLELLYIHGCGFTSADGYQSDVDEFLDLLSDDWIL